MLVYDILTFVGRFLYQTWRTLELIFVIWPIEFAMRLWWALDPRVYFQKLRIKRVNEGTVAKRDGVFYVFVLYCKSQLPEFTENGLNAIAGSPHNLIIVSNTTLSPLIKKKLLNKCHKLIERKNVGRDFGAYKDGVNYVLEHYPDAGRIVIVNDSVFFLRRNLDKLIADLNGPYEFIGITEVHQFHYHVQSFLLSFGGDAIKSKTFIRFWKRYLPINTRRWAIHNGEIRLTRVMTRAGFRPHILFQAAHLLQHLQSMPAREVIENTRLLPTEIRSQIYSNYLSVLGERYSATGLSTVEAIASGVRPISNGAVRATADSQVNRLSSRAADMEQVSLGIFPSQIIHSISQNNQMHHGGLLFIKYLDLPLLKRDIFYRELYSLEDIYEFLTNIGEPLREEMLGDLRRSGSGAHLRGLFRIMFRHGSL